MLPFILCLFVTASTAESGPRFLETASNVTATVGDTAVLPCAVRDLSHYAVIWQGAGEFPLTIGDLTWTEDDRISVQRPYLKDYNLVIRDVKLKDSGQYKCQVSTRPAMTRSVTLKVTETRPRFLETPRNVMVNVGGTAVLPCAVSDLKDYQVAWTDEYHSLLIFEDRRIVDDHRISLERPYVKDWNLHIRDVRLSDSGEYQCQVNTSPVMITSVFLTVTVAGQDEETSWRPRYDGHDVMNGSMSYNVTWASGQGSVRLLATTHSLLLSVALVNWVCWF